MVDKVKFHQTTESAVPDVFHKTGWNYDPVIVSEDTGLLCMDASRTIQSQREESDINVIVRIL